jgi:hypothetical protein
MTLWTMDLCDEDALTILSFGFGISSFGFQIGADAHIG